MIHKGVYDLRVKGRDRFLEHFKSDLQQPDYFGARVHDLRNYFDTAEIKDNKLHFQVMDHKFIVESRIQSDNERSIIFETFEKVESLKRNGNANATYNYIKDLDIYLNKHFEYTMRDKGKSEWEQVFDEYCERLMKYLDYLETDD